MRWDVCGLPTDLCTCEHAHNRGGATIVSLGASPRKKAHVVELYRQILKRIAWVSCYYLYKERHKAVADDSFMGLDDDEGLPALFVALVQLHSSI